MIPPTLKLRGGGPYPKVHIRVKGGAEIDGSPFIMTAVDPGYTDFMSGVTYYFAISTLTATTSGYEHKFDVFDEYSKQAILDYVDNPYVNSSPVLSWAGTAGYETDAINPDACVATSTVTFKIKYTDVDEEAPAQCGQAGGYPQLNILKDGATIQTLTMLEESGSYGTGAIFSTSTLLSACSYYSYTVIAYDTNGYKSTSTILEAGPDIGYKISGYVLLPEPGNDPMEGATVSIECSELSITRTYTTGSDGYYELIGTLNNDWTLTVSSSPGGGTTSFTPSQVAFNDLTSDHPDQNFERVKGAPELMWANVANYMTDGMHPEVGASTTTFEFRVKYTDSANDAPKAGYPKVKITKPCASEIYISLNYTGSDYVAGVVCSTTTTLDPGKYTYIFEAPDVWDEAASGDASSQVQDPDVHAYISGDVVFPSRAGEPEGIPLEGAKLELSYNDGGPVTRTLYTDANGQYQFNMLKTGLDYDLVASSHAYYSFTPTTFSVTDLSANTTCQFVRINRSSITWTGETNYVSDGLHPELDETGGQTFTYRCKYLDHDNDMPAPGYPRVRILKGGTTVQDAVMTEVNGSDTDYTDGKLYSHETTLSSGLDYSYYFVSKDTFSLESFTQTMSGPEVSTSTPVLEYLGTTGYETDGVEPNTDSPGTNFDFRVVYKDSDNDPPQSGYPKVHIREKGGSEVAESPFTMISVDPAYTDFTLGVTYYFEISTLTATSSGYEHKFVTYDQHGKQAVLDYVDYPYVNSTPLLSWTGEAGYTSEAVEPDVGISTTTIVFRIEYTDSDDEAPQSGYPQLNILQGGTTIQALSMNKESGDYDTGAIYSTSTLLGPCSYYTYSVVAYDTNGYQSTSTISGTGPDIGYKISANVYNPGSGDFEGAVASIECSALSITRTFTTGSDGYYELIGTCYNDWTLTVSSSPNGGTASFTPVQASFSNLTSNQTQNFQRDAGAPELVWAGVANYMTDGVEPHIGASTTTFEFRAKYTDSENDAPTTAGGYPRVKITKSGSSPIYIQLNYTGNDYVTGVVCSTTTTLDPGIYSYVFEAPDIWNEAASGDASSSQTDDIDVRAYMSGDVIFTDGAPLEGAKLELSYNDSGPITKTSYTDANGQYQFNMLKTGLDYDLVASSHTYYSFTPTTFSVTDLSANTTCQFVRINRSSITWTGEANYVSDGLHPELDETGGQTFTYRCKYLDEDNDMPAAGYPRVRILKGGTTIQDAAMSEVNGSDTDYTDGKLYTYDIATLQSGRDYTYYFVSKDTFSAELQTPTRDGPIVSTYTPVLSYPTSSAGWVGDGSDGVYPDEALLGSTFEFRVMYQDQDNDPPAAGYPKVHIREKGGSEVEESPFTMTEVDPGYTDFMSGVTYYFAISTLAATTSGYEHKFDVLDEYSKQATLDYVDNPYVNSSPILSWAGTSGYTSDAVEPEVGISTTTITFRIKYTDVDNEAPQSGYPQLNILKGGTTIQALSMSKESGDYDTGAIYSTSTLLNPCSYYTYNVQVYDTNGYQSTSTISGTDPDIGYKISGYVYDPSGGDFEGAVASIECSALSITRTYTTGSDGYYELIGTCYNDWTLTVSSSPGGGTATFTPSQQDFVNLTGSQSQNFTRDKGAPELVWAGVTGFETDGLAPEVGASTTTFELKVKYTDSANDAPASGYPRVRIKQGGSTVSLIEMSYTGNDYVTGVICSTTTILDPGMYTYIFESPDIWNEDATGDPADSETDGPDVRAYISGNVCKPDDNPMPGAKLELSYDDSGPVTETLYTDANGQYQFNMLKTGLDYDLAASSHAYYSFTPTTFSVTDLSANTTCQFVRINRSSVTWTGEANYVSDGLHPELDETGGQTFTYRCQYLDEDNDPPYAKASGGGPYPKVHILKGGTDISGSPFTMSEVNGSDTDYTDGKLYTYDIATLQSGRDYTYYFVSKDTFSAELQTPTIDGPIVSTYTPVLLYPASSAGWVGDGSDGVDPDEALVGSTFEFRVMYRDQDNDPPYAEASGGGPYPKVHIRVKGGAEIEGSPFTMTPIDPGYTDFISGVTYYFAISTLAATTSGYEHKFDVLDEYSKQAILDYVDNPYVNSSPILSWAGTSGYTSDAVEPEIGISTTVITFKIKYTDVDNEAPAQGGQAGGYPQLNILKGGTTIQALSMNLESGDYNTGAIYSTSTLLSPCSYYTYNVIAYDTNGYQSTSTPTGTGPDVGYMISGYVKLPEPANDPMEGAVASIECTTLSITRTYTTGADGYYELIGTCYNDWTLTVSSNPGSGTAEFTPSDVSYTNLSGAQSQDFNSTGGAPELVWAGGTGFTNDGFEPGVGASTTTWEFCVKYTDDENDPPGSSAAGRPKVRIMKSGMADIYIPLNYTSGDYAAGVVCSTTTRLEPGKYTYLFEAQDIWSTQAAGEASIEQTSPLVDVRAYVSGSVVFPPMDGESSGAPMPGAKLELSHDDGGGPITDTLYSDSNGYFYFGMLKTGLDYDLVASSHAYYSFTPTTFSVTDLSANTTCQFVRINRSSITWTGEANYVSDGLHPELDETGGQTFTYRCKYLDEDNDMPAPGYPRVRILKGGTTVQDAAMSEVSAGDTDYTDGKFYTYDTTTLQSGRNYTYYFVSKDTFSAELQTPTIDGPIVSTYTPVLSYPTSSAGWVSDGSDGVYPDEALLGSTFEFRVMYQDQDNDPPYAEVSGGGPYPKVHIRVKGGAEIEGSPFTMTPIDPGYTDFISGVTYYFAISTLAATTSGYEHKFDVLDEYSKQAILDYVDNPYVNSSPILSWAGTSGYTSDAVEPEIGISTTVITFKIKYTDVDNEAPQSGYPQLNILKGGTTIQALSMNKESGDYNTGAIYSTSTLLSPCSYYTYNVQVYDTNGYAGLPAEASAKAGPDIGYKISGYVYFPDSDPFSGAVASIECSALGIARTYTTGADGYFELIGTCNNEWTLTVSSSPGGGTATFEPAHTDFSNLCSNQIQNFEYVKWPPMLSWTGDVNFISDSINPDIGTSTTTFEFRVKYQHTCNDAPADGYPRVRIKKDGGTVKLLQMNYTGDDYVAGVICSTSTTLDPGKYSYIVEAQDVWGKTAIGDAISEASEPDVRAYISGDVYDPDGNPMPGIKLELSYEKDYVPTTEITHTDTNGEFYFGMVETGIDYTLTPSSYSYYSFTPSTLHLSPLTCDTTCQFMRVNRSSTVWAGDTGFENDGINPDIDTADGALFTYRCKYLDLDNDPPYAKALGGGLYPKVHILKGGVDITGSPFTMSEVNGSDTDYTDGKLYSYQTTLPVGLEYSYYFISKDTFSMESCTPVMFGPVFNTIPELSWGTTSIGPNPVTGIPEDLFTYKVVYTDSDNDPPMEGYPKLHVMSCGQDIKGSPFTMYYSTGNYLDGAVYEYSVFLSTGIGYTYRIECYDYYGSSTNALSGNGPDVLSRVSGYVLAPDGEAMEGIDVTLNSSRRGGIYDAQRNMLDKSSLYKRSKSSYKNICITDEKGYFEFYVSTSAYTISVSTPSYYVYYPSSYTIENIQTHTTGYIFNRVSRCPMLECAGAPGYEADCVEPDVADPHETVSFKVLCTDPDRDEIMDAYPVLYLLKEGTTVQSLLMIKESGNNIDGIVFSTSTLLDTVGTYYYLIRACDIYSAESEDFYAAFEVYSEPPPPPVNDSPLAQEEAVVVPTKVVISWEPVGKPGEVMIYTLYLSDPQDITVLPAARMAPYFSSSINMKAVYTGPDPSYSVEKLDAGKTYYWQVKAVDSVGASSVSPVYAFKTLAVQVTKAYNYPNPFNPATGQNTNIVFNMEYDGEAQVKIYSEFGDLCWSKTTGSLSAGANEVTYDGTDDEGRLLYNGTYVCIINKKYAGTEHKDFCRILIIK